jgi:2-dehydro-3-deoxygalactonokinase
MNGGECRAAALIAIDWGTTNFRAALLDDAGTVLQRRQAPRGISQVAPGRYGATLTELLGDWFLLQPQAPVLMAGMVGSAGGLVEVPYLPCPASTADLSEHLFVVPELDVGREVRIVPGLSARSVSGHHDVMRGEEVQIAGSEADDRILCLPGTHSKWVLMRGGRVESFSTSMTGDAYAALRGHTILRQFAAEGEHDPGAFARGMDCAGRPGGLLHHLFSDRSEVLLGDLPAASAASYLSGLLIGSEVAAMTRALDCSPGVDVIGTTALASLYGEALDASGHRYRVVDGDQVALRGLHRLARAAGLLGGTPAAQSCSMRERK